MISGRGYAYANCNHRDDTAVRNPQQQDTLTADSDTEFDDAEEVAEDSEVSA